jgi:6-phosphogluconate dehydrogenase (decarboxylating)
MIPAAIVDKSIEELTALVSADDIIIPPGTRSGFDFG